MNILVIGDVHGCYYSYKHLISKYWDHKNELLIQLGDLIDRGNLSPQCVDLSRRLNSSFPTKTIFLKGNHEAEMVSHFESGPNENWLHQCGEKTLSQYSLLRINPKNHVEWFKALPPYWKNNYLFISHAGIAIDATNPYDEKSLNGILWNRSKLKNIGKIQILGHTPCKANNPFYCNRSNSWSIDTGSGHKNGFLSALRITKKGKLVEIIRLRNVDREIE